MNFAHQSKQQAAHTSSKQLFSVKVTLLASALQIKDKTDVQALATGEIGPMVQQIIC